MTIHEQENILLEEWWNSYPANERDNFVMDGLCYNGPLNERGTNSFSGNEEKLWVNTKRKIVFLMKDLMVIPERITETGIGELSQPNSLR
ncbi:hypothetical protein ACIXST_07100 [Bacteroides fragilis]